MPRASIEVLLNNANFSRKQGELDRAERLALAAKDAGQRDDATLILAMVELDRGNLAAAEYTFQEAYELGAASAAVRLTRIFRMQNRHEEADEWSRRVTVRGQDGNRIHDWEQSMGWLDAPGGVRQR